MNAGQLSRVVCLYTLVFFFILQVRYDIVSFIYEIQAKAGTAKKAYRVVSIL